MLPIDFNKNVKKIFDFGTVRFEFGNVQYELYESSRESLYFFVLFNKKYKEGTKKYKEG